MESRFLASRWYSEYGNVAWHDGIALLKAEVVWRSAPAPCLAVRVLSDGMGPDQSTDPVPPDYPILHPLFAGGIDALGLYFDAN